MQLHCAGDVAAQRREPLQVDRFIALAWATHRRAAMVAAQTRERLVALDGGLASGGPPNRPLDQLVALAAIEREVRDRIGQQVAACKDEGISWAEIGKALQVSRQAAHERFHRRRPT